MINRTLTIIIYSLFFLITLPADAQSVFRVMSYNVENLFDTTDDPEKEDNEYLPNGGRHWSNGRYYLKLQQIAKVINAVGQWSTPALVGLCEVENDSVLHHLLHRTPLRQQQYRYCITHGADTRGINVALLYQRDLFGYIDYAEHPVQFSRNRHKRTRHILHVWGKLSTSDTLDVFVCHFPSRYGGEKESEKERFDAARTLRRLCDSLFHTRLTLQILIMGDFNDTPENNSIKEILAARPLPEIQESNASTSNRSHPILPEKKLPDLLSLFNLFATSKTLKHPGSHKYQGEWSQLDQIIVSENLIHPRSGLHLKAGSNQNVDIPFLLVADKTWRGMRPKRSFYGFKYEGGYSDHLPLVTDFVMLQH